MHEIRDIALAPEGAVKIDWVKKNMPLLRGLEKEFAQTKPFEGLKVALSVHLEAKTAYLCLALAAGGAEMYVTAEPASTQDDIAAARPTKASTSSPGTARRRRNTEHLNRVIEVGQHYHRRRRRPVNLIHGEYAGLLPGVIGGCESDDRHTAPALHGKGGRTEIPDDRGQ